MGDAEQRAGFDVQPPMPVSEYEAAVKRGYVGYELLFTLTHCLLRALRQPALDLLVVGAGGGMEIAQFLPDNPGWRLTGVDPSQDMLALAQAKADDLHVASQVTLVRGTVQDLPADAQFDAATCINVLHFLSDDQKSSLLRDTASRLRPGAPMLVASGSHGDSDGLDDLLLGAWQEYGEMRGMPTEQMAGMIARITSHPDAVGPDSCVHMLHAAGFGQVACFFSALNGVAGWIAR